MFGNYSQDFFSTIITNISNFIYRVSPTFSSLVEEVLPSLIH
jgi:hypothetical protein